MHTHRFRVTGGQKLKGVVQVSGSKNAALPIMAACLLTNEPVTLKNVPDIADIYTMQHILHFLGVKANFDGHTLKIHAKAVADIEIEHELVSKLRGSIVLLGPLLARNGDVRLAFPGGCVLGKRPVDAHMMALKALGATVTEEGDVFHLRAKKLFRPVTLFAGLRCWSQVVNRCVDGPRIFVESNGIELVSAGQF